LFSFEFDVDDDVGGAFELFEHCDAFVFRLLDGALGALVDEPSEESTDD
jgi:hypothetical protein